MIKFRPASSTVWDSQKPGQSPNYLPVDSQIGPERSKQAGTDISQPCSQLVCWLADSGRAQEKILDHYNDDHSEITQNAKVSSKASVCSCQVFWPNFYKNKIFNFVFIEIVSVAFTFFLFLNFHSISNVEKNLPVPGGGSKMAS